jgi:hypothetical protein
VEENPKLQSPEVIEEYVKALIASREVSFTLYERGEEE